MSENEYLLKICVVGLSQDHRKFFVRSFAETMFDDQYLPTLGVDITTKKIPLDNYQVKLILVDAAGYEFFGKLRPSYYRGASAFLIAFDKTDRKSLDVVPEWEAEFKKYVQPDVLIALVGIIAKQYMHREPEVVISTEEGQALADKLGFTYFECDFTTTIPSVDEPFIYLARKAIEISPEKKGKH